MLGVLRLRNYALLWAGALISMIGDWVLIGALPFYIYQRTGSAVASGAMFMAEIAPMLLLGSVAGVFVDRWDRKRTMVVCDVLRGILILLLFAVSAADWLWVVYVVAFVQSCFAQFGSTAFNAFVPRLVEEDQLVAANSGFAVANNVGRLVGPAIGGLLMAIVGLPAVVLVDSASFFVSALLVRLIAASALAGSAGTVSQPSATRASARDAAARVWREWLDGLRLVARDRAVAAIFVVMGIALLGDSMITVLAPPFISRILQADARVFGWALTARGLGGLVGGLVIGRMARAIGPGRLIAASAAADGAILLAMIAFSTIPTTVGLMVLAGIPTVGFYASMYTLLQSRVSDSHRGRVFGTYTTTSALTLLVGMAVAAGLGDVVGIVPMLAVAAGLYVTAGLAALLGVRPGPSTQPAPATSV